MSGADIASIIASALSLIGVIFTVASGNKKITTKMEIAQAVTDTKLTNLTDEVRQHNNFAQRIPVIEEKLNGLDRRVESLERSSS